MSYTSLLINTCTVRRYTEGVADAYGRPARTWADVAALTDIDCRFMAGVGRGFLSAGIEHQMNANLVTADYTLYLGDVDLTEQDRITSGGVTYEILMVADRQNGTANHHKECLIKTAR